MTRGSLILAWAVGCVSAAAFAGDCQIIEGDRILARDLAAAIPQFAELDPKLAIGPAPLAGVRRVFHAAELARLAREHSIELPAPVPETCVERATGLLTAGELAPVLATAFGHEGAQVEVLDFSRYPVPRGSWEFSRAALSPAGLWRGRVMYGGGRSVSVWARVRITDAATGQELPLSPASGPREVERGDSVRVEVSAGQATVAFDAVAESSGRKGEMVLVKSPESGRRLLAKVQEKGKVLIKK